MRPLPVFLVGLSALFLHSTTQTADAATAKLAPGSASASATASAGAAHSNASASATAEANPPTDQPALKHAAQHLLRVGVTAQAHDFTRPWSKRAPVPRRSLGVVLSGGHVLVTGECVANANYIELETADGERKEPAVVECVDYEANLALLKPESPAFLKDLPGLDLTTAHIGDALSVLQLEANGQVQTSSGKVTTAEVTRYPVDESSFLVCRLSVPLQMRDGMLSIPVIKEGSLTGLMLRYDPGSSLMDFIPAPVIAHFLKDYREGSYEGFPRMGCAFSPTRDPQLRRYLGLNGNNGGVLITQVLAKGPAEMAGLRKGDVLLEIGGKNIDSNGNYEDEEFGRISLGHLVSTRHYQGQKVKSRVWREGQTLEVDVPVARRKPNQYMSEPYIIDRAPRYVVLGGLVFQELSRQFLREFGSDWQRKAPLELVHIDRAQSEQDAQTRKRAVILTRVLPSQVTVGYEDLRNMLVTSINGMPLESLEDIPKALEKAVNGLHRIEFKGDPAMIFIDAKAAEASGPVLQRAYGLPALSRLE